MDGMTNDRGLRRAIWLVAALNAVYGIFEAGTALWLGSISLLADSVDFGEDAAVNLLVAIALAYVARREASLWLRARLGRVLAIIILIPALIAGGEAVWKAFHPEIPEAGPLMLVAVGALVVNVACAIILAHVRHHGGSLTTAAWLAARNDALINVAIIAVGALTAWLTNAYADYAPYPDLLLGVLIIGLNLGAAKEVWEVAKREDLAAKAMSGEDLED